MAYEHITVDRRGRVGLITLNRPKALNALNGALIGELNAVLDSFEAEEEIGAVVLTGNEKAFAAGADITEMRSMSFVDAHESDFIASWNRITAFRKPVDPQVEDAAEALKSELADLEGMYGVKEARRISSKKDHRFTGIQRVTCDDLAAWAAESVRTGAAA